MEYYNLKESYKPMYELFEPTFEPSYGLETLLDPQQGPCGPIPCGPHCRPPTPACRPTPCGPC